MFNHQKIKLTTLLAVLLISQTTIAAPNTDSTIFDSSLKWNNKIPQTKLFESIPVWSKETRETLFDVYRTPERYQLSTIQDSNKYNIQFINAFWGPLENPFNNSPRPAKVFLFVNQKTFLMAPIMKDAENGDYYVFDNHVSQPVLLTDWVIQFMKTKHISSVQINICNGYANLPTDSCKNKTYQSETSDIDWQYNLRKQTNLASAYRAPNVDWKMKINTKRTLTSTGQDSIVENSIAWENTDARNALLNTVIAWPNLTTIQTNFEKIRDLRYFQDEEKQSKFLRRITWLYPNDGCWTRATAVIKDLFGPLNNQTHSAPRPSKLFAFGNLCANTPNSPSGKVTWWYHTAPIIRDSETNQMYVLDPSVNPHVPLTIETWIKEISSNNGACAESNSSIDNINICNGYGVSPYDSCEDPTLVNHQTERLAMLEQRQYRSFERHRQAELKRDADTVLGDMPPWRKN